MMKSRNQLLITGCYRSGTEYFTQLLNNHPKLAAKMYTTNFMRYYYKKYSDPLLIIPKIKEMIKKRFNIDISDEISGYLKNRKNVTEADVYDAIMSNLYIKGEKTQWAEKTQLVWRQIPDFLKMFPTGKAIIVIRDPRNVLTSFKKHTYAPEPLYLGAIFNCYDSMKYASKYEKEYPKRFLKVRYEDLILKPEKTLINTFKFLGLDSEHDLLSETDWVNTNGTPWGHNSEFVEKNKIFNKKENIINCVTPVWEKILKPWEITFCEDVCRPFMKENNYNMSDKVVIPPKKIFMDYNIERYLKKWYNDEGIQEFPTDPIDEENWSENRTKEKK